MLRVEALPRPPRHPFPHVGAGPLRIVIGQVDEVRDTIPEVGRGRQVVALCGFLEKRRDASAKLADVAKIEERQRQIQVRGVELPGHAGALLSQDGFGPTEQLARGRPLSLKVRAGAFSEREERAG